MRYLILILVVLLACQCGFAQETPKLERATQAKLRGIAVDLAAAQKSEDEA